MFDPRTARELAPGSHLTIDDCPGLRLEATDKYRTWTYRYRSPVDEKMRQIKLGRWPAMSFAAAMGEWEAKRQLRDKGMDPAAEKRQARHQATRAAAETKAQQVMTVGRVADDYVEKVVKLRRKKKGSDEVARMFATMLGADASLPAATYTRKQAYALIERWVQAPVQAAKLRSELAGAWDRALDAGDLPEESPNWWRQIMRGQLKSKGKKINGVSQGTKKRVLKDLEMGQLINWLPNFTALIDDALTLYLWTGTRGDEIMEIEAEEVTEEADGLWWTVPKEKTKNSWREKAGDLRVPLVGRAEVVVRRRIARFKSGYLFPSRGKFGYTEQKTIQSTVYFHQPYCRTRPKAQRLRLTVTHWAPHDLRRSVRTKLAALGCPGDIGEAVLGHVKPGVEGIYNLHEYDRERREWLTKLDQELERLAQAAL